MLVNACLYFEPLFLQDRMLYIEMGLDSWGTPVTLRDIFSANSHYSNGIIVKDSRYIFRREFIGGIRYEQARLADCTVADDNTSKENEV
jgi:hypothetical protein